MVNTDPHLVQLGFRDFIVLVGTKPIPSTIESLLRRRFLAYGAAAAGVLLVHDADALGYGWDVVRNTWAGPQLDLAGSDAVRPAVEGWVQKDAARTLFAAAGLDFTALSAAAANSTCAVVKGS